MRTYLVAVAVFVLLPPVLFAQYAETLSQIGDSESITTEQALWLVGSSSGSIEPGATMKEAGARLSALDLPTSFLTDDATPDRGVNIADFSLLLMQVEEVPGGFWYGVAPSPFTAYRHLQGVGVIPAEDPPSLRLSGAAAIDLTRRYLDFAGRFVSEAKDR